MDFELSQIIKDLEIFFKTKVSDYKIEMANSREEFNRLTNRKTQNAGWPAGRMDIELS